MKINKKIGTIFLLIMLIPSVSFAANLKIITSNDSENVKLTVNGTKKFTTTNQKKCTWKKENITGKAILTNRINSETVTVTGKKEGTVKLIAKCPKNTVNKTIKVYKSNTTNNSVNSIGLLLDANGGHSTINQVTVVKTVSRYQLVNGSITVPYKINYGFEGYYYNNIKLIARKGALRDDNLKKLIKKYPNKNKYNLKAKYLKLKKILLKPNNSSIISQGTLNLYYTKKSSGLLFDQNGKMNYSENVVIPKSSNSIFKGYYASINGKNVKVIDENGKIIMVKSTAKKAETYGWKIAKLLKSDEKNGKIILKAKWQKSNLKNKGATGNQTNKTSTNNSRVYNDKIVKNGIKINVKNGKYGLILSSNHNSDYSIPVAPTLYNVPKDYEPYIEYNYFASKYIKNAKYSTYKENSYVPETGIFNMYNDGSMYIDKEAFSYVRDNKKDMDLSFKLKSKKSINLQGPTYIIHIEYDN